MNGCVTLYPIERWRISGLIRAALHANARTGRGPKYLFSGLLACGQCGRKFIIVDPTRYGCSGWKYRGLTVCNNTILAPRKLVEGLLLEAIQHDLFTEEYIRLFKQETAKQLAEQQRTQRPPNLAQAKARLAVLEKEITNIASAIKQGVLTVTTKAELEKAEAERAALVRAIQGDQRQPAKVEAFLPNAVGRFKALIDDLANVTQLQVDRARGILRVVLGKEILLHPTADGVKRYLTAEVSGDYEGLVRLATGQHKFGGGQALLPLLTQALRFELHGVALVA